MVSARKTAERATLTRPCPKRLAEIRSNVGRIVSRPHRAVEALDASTGATVVEAVADLAAASTAEAENTVTALLHASHDRRAEVRAAAARAMAVHPYGAICDRVGEMERFDKDLTVRAAAKQAFEEMHDIRPSCLQCGSDGYRDEDALRLPESSDPHGEWVDWPVFCSKDCAVEYALDRVREDFDASTIHECLQSGAFEMCPREECSRCAAAELVGRSTDPNGLSGYVAIECVCDQIPEDARPCLPCEMRGANTPETTSPDSTKGAR